YIFYSTTPRPPPSTLFPYTTLFRSNNTGQNGGIPDADIDAPEAWDITTGSSDVVVAVIDTGIDYTHPDLSANMFRNELDCNSNRSEEHTSELQSRFDLVCRLLLEKK